MSGCLLATGVAPASADPADPSALPAPLEAVLPDSTADTVAALTAGSGVGISTVVTTGTRVEVVPLDAGTRSDAEQAVGLLDAQPGVTAGLATPVHAIGDTTSQPVSAAGEYDDLQWDLPRINAGPARNLVASALPSITVAVLDTGVAAHPELVPHLVAGQNFTGGDAADTTDRHFHGTHVAGTIGATVDGVSVDGVAGGVRIMPVKVLSDSGSGSSTGVAQGIVWAADHGADVINMSLGGPGSDPAQQTAIDYARSKGVVVVAAAGNDAQNGNPVTYPCADAGTVCVGATDEDDAWAPFSVYGPQVTLSAPGVDILSTYLDTDVTYANGTSMATPHVAAVAALVKAVSRALTPDQVAAVLTRTVVDLGPAGRDDQFGAGRIDALAAVQAAFVEADQPPPANQAPTAGDLSVEVPSTAGTTVIDAMSAASDPDGDRLTYSAVGPAAAGTVSLVSEQIRYTPAAGGATDTFPYTVTDGRGGSATGTVHVTVIRPLPAPAGLTATGRNASVSLTWTAVPGAASYEVWRNGGYLSMAAGTGYVDTAVQNGIGYFYQLRAVSSAGVPGDFSGSISATPAAAQSPIDVLYQRLGGASGQLGVATSGDRPVAGGTVRDFTNGQILLPPGATAAVSVSGAVAAKYAAVGGAGSWLGWPTTDEVCGLRDGGCYQRFQRATSYWSASTGAHFVRGAIGAGWAAQGWETGPSGFPTTDEVCGLRDGGCYQRFQRATSYWSPATGAHALSGTIRDRWSRQGWENGRLGYPTSDAAPVPGGRSQRFQGGTLIGA